VQVRIRPACECFHFVDSSFNLLILVSDEMEGPYVTGTNLSYYDIAAPGTSSFPHEYFVGFLSQNWVQKALGVPLNFTESSNSVYAAFTKIGDSSRGGLLEDIAAVLESGVKVALVYGDRDFACNWIGGENVSLNIPWSQQQKFSSAGYTDLQVNSSYVGGQTRQYGNLSFTRVYESGHEVPAYQPQTAYEIFRRVMNNLDVATGSVSTVGSDTVYVSQGPADTWAIKNKVPTPPPAECYILSPATCTDDQLTALENGTAQVHNYIFGETASGGSGSSSSPKKSEAFLVLPAFLSICIPAFIALLVAF
jgi:Serine carboxypeptidase